jgi:CRISPR-associated protein Csx10
VAARYLREIGEPGDETFNHIFLRNGVLFSNLYPVREGKDLAKVLPATARSCKAHGGFLHDLADDPAGHGVSDMLMRAAAFQVSRDYSLIDEITVCPRCKQQTHRFAGFYERHSDPDDYYSKVVVHKRHQTHVGINRKRQSAEQGFLFAQQVINEAKPRSSARRNLRPGLLEAQENEPDMAHKFDSQFFAGDLIIKDELSEFLMNTLLAEDTRLWLGESRSRGLGQMQVALREEAEADTSEVVSERISKFNKKFVEHIRQAEEVSYFSITLQSDAIISDAFMRPKAVLEGGDLIQALSIDSPDDVSHMSLQSVYASAGTRLIQSWNMASGYPKPDDMAIAMGSVFLFKVDQMSATDLAGPLAILEERGIGKRRSEGFGRLVVCDPFHWEVSELWQNI